MKKILLCLALFCLATGPISCGDSNTDDGTDIPKEDVVGKVVLVLPKIGAAVRLVRTPTGMLGLFAAIILITELPNLIGYIRRKGKKQEN